ncbi:AraC family transcriptional regulator [Colwellia sp. UCD-KL20]|uniref:helix-turn-helix transcriptional regulator n=1 Tax=Colwellia sp. UCD-KL20 TaxID=1917165 RepID=UPI000970DE22|nr:AraC family transcriptional regulator [Colwellia sp. UCD-KL20]
MTEWLDVLEIGPECNERFVECNKVPELDKLEIKLCGVSFLSGKYCVGRADPMCHTIFYVVDGSLELHTEKGQQTIDKGHLVTLPAHKPFLIELQSENFSMVWFDLNDCLHWRTLCENRPSVALCESGRQIFHLLSFIYYERSNILRQSSVKQLEYYLDKTLCAESSVSSDHQKLDQLIRDIEKKLHFNWTVKDMGAIIHYSSPHLHRLFQKRFTRSPIQHLIFLRMERAKYLLKNTTWSIEQIAEQVGYKDVFNFSKRFKKSIGLPPGLFRKTDVA